MHTYKIGKRVWSTGILLMILLSLVIFTFYFIYDYVMTPVFPRLKGAPLIAIFILLEAVMLVLVRWGCGKYQSSVLYTVTPEALVIRMGKNQQTIKWESFEEARTMSVSFLERSPITYTVSGSRFVPNQYLDQIWELNHDIVTHIRPYARIEDGLEQQINAFL